MAFFQDAVLPWSARRSRFFFPETLSVRTVSTFFAEELLNSTLDFQLVRVAINLKHVLVVILLKKGCLLADENVINDLIDIFHGNENSVNG